MIQDQETCIRTNSRFKPPQAYDIEAFSRSASLSMMVEDYGISIHVHNISACQAWLDHPLRCMVTSTINSDWEGE